MKCASFVANDCKFYKHEIICDSYLFFLTREYSISDQQIDCKLLLELQGDVTICVYHGRSTLGGKVQGKLTSIPMFQIQFHTGFVGVKAKKMVFIK